MFDLWNQLIIGSTVTESHIIYLKFEFCKLILYQRAVGMNLVSRYSDPTILNTLCSLNYKIL